MTEKEIPPKTELKYPFNDLPLKILQEVYHYQDFRPHQQDVIHSILQGKSTLAIMPTGAGKSICFQIPALILPGLTVIISPLIALMKDQVDSLMKKGIMNAVFLNSSLREDEQEEIYKSLRQQKIKLLYIAPESLFNAKLLHLLNQIQISMIAIDEAHCISMWGHNFRPDYLKIKEIVHELGDPPVLALTATATQKVEKDIIQQLSLHFNTFRDTFDRKNLYLSVLELKPGQEKNKIVKEILEKVPGPAVIYVNFVKTTEELASFLNANGFSSQYYHGSLEHRQRKEIQDNFLKGETRVIVATNAFGMGIDKSDIRIVIHYNIPKSLENYYQETGRAGRDGKPAYSILLYSQEDSAKLKRYMKLTTPDKDKIEHLQRYFAKEAGKTIYPSLRDISDNLHLEEVTLKLLLHYLEKLNLIKMHNRIFRKAMIQQLATLPDEPGVKKIFSSYYYEKYREEWMNIEELAKVNEIPLEKVNTILQNLASKNVIKLAEGNVSTPIKVYRAITSANASEVESLFQKLSQNSISKLQDVLQYIQNQGCRKKFLLNYFGESANISCRICNFCDPSLLESLMEVQRNNGKRIILREKDLQLLQQVGELKERMKAMIGLLEVVQELEAKEIHTGKNYLSDLVRGSKSKRILQSNFQTLRGYGSLSHLAAKEILSLILYLLKEGYLVIVDADAEYPRPLLYLTEYGKNLLQLKESIKV